MGASTWRYLAVRPWHVPRPYWSRCNAVSADTRRQAREISERSAGKHGRHLCGRTDAPLSLTSVWRRPVNDRSLRGLKSATGRQHQPPGPPKAAVLRGNGEWRPECWTRAARSVGMPAVRRSDDRRLRPEAVDQVVALVPQRPNVADDVRRCCIWGTK